MLSLEVLDYGSYLGVEGHEFVIKNKNLVVSRVPFHEAKRAVISSGNNISSTALRARGGKTRLPNKRGRNPIHYSHE